MDTVLVVALINLLIDWLGKQPVAPGGPTQEQLNETDAKWQAAKAKWGA
jgi:hypothetical protein